MQGLKWFTYSLKNGELKNLICMNKPAATEHLDKTLEVAKWCKEAKLDSGSFFILGYPGGKFLIIIIKKL